MANGGSGPDDNPRVVQEEMRRRKAWFLECQLRGLNLETFRDVTADPPPYALHLLHLLSEELFPIGFPAGQFGPMQPLGRVYLDSQEPVWTKDESERRREFGPTLTGILCNWLDFKEPYRLAARLADLKAKFEASALSSEADFDPHFNEHGRRWARHEADVAHATCRATIAEAKPWLIPELYNDRQTADPRGTWLDDLEQFIAAFERELQIVVGRPTAAAVEFDPDRTGAYRAWIRQLLDRSTEERAGDHVEVRFLEKVKAAPEDQEAKYQYAIKIKTHGFALGSAADYPLSWKVPYWTRNISKSLGGVYLNVANSDMGLCLLIRLLYLFGAMPASLATGGELPWRCRAAPGAPFDQCFQKKAEASPFKDDPAALAKLRALQGRLRIILEESAAVTRSASPVFSPIAGEILRQGLLHYKFWLDEPFRAKGNEELNRARLDTAIGKDEDAEMEYWSENHYIMFASSEYLAGQLWEADAFQPAKSFLRGKDEPGVLTGAERKARGRARVLKWLNNRLLFGWAEFNSSGYYREHLWALLNLVDFALDAEVRDKAAVATDLLLFDVVRFLHKGAMGAAGGRTQFKFKAGGRDGALGDIAELMLGSLGIFHDREGLIGAAFATSTYKVPDVLLEIGMFPPREGCVDRSRVSIGFDESPKYGIYYSKRSTATDSLFAGYASKRHRYFPFVQAVNDDIARSHSWYGAFEDDIVFWWGMSAFFNKQIVRGTFTCIDRFGLDKSGVFKGFIPLLIGTLIPLVKRTQAKNLGLTAAGALAGDFGEAALEEDTADELSLLLEGSTRTRANLLTYRNGDVMMSTLQNFRPGQLNFQSSVNQATLNSTLTVFTTSGFAGFEISNLAVAEGGALLGGIVGGPIGAVAGGVGAVIVNESLIEGMNPIDQVDGPDWWTGYWSLPVIAQHRSAVIAAYDFHAIQKFLAEAGSHAWFPKAGFDRVEEARTSAYEDENFFLLDVDNIGPKGFWLFGKVVHRVEGVSAADWPEAYIGVFSNQRPQWLSLAEDADIYEERLGEKADEGVWKRPLPMDYFADRDWYVEGKNVWIVQVGNQDEFGGFDEFKRRVTGARIALDDSGGMECSYDIPLPGGSSERLSLTYEDGGRFSLDGRPFQTDYYPRFENRFLRSGRAEWGQRAYVIEYRGKTLLHDYSDYGNPIRREAFQPTEDEADLVRALVIFLKTEDEALEEFAVGTATVRIGGQTATEAQVIAAGPVSEETPHDAEWIFFDRAVRCAPDATLELGHGLIANRTSLLDAMTSPEEFALDLLEGSPEWTVSFSVKALMGDCTLRDCSLTAGRASFEDRSVAGPFPFSIALSKWRRWEPVATRTSRRRLIAGRPPWGTAYYDYCDLLAWDDDDRLWHRRIDACLRAEPKWLPVAAADGAPDFSGAFSVHARSGYPGALSVLVAAGGVLYAAWLENRDRWSPWTKLEPYVYPTILGIPVTTAVPVPVAVGANVFAGPSRQSADGIELYGSGADGHVYCHLDWRPGDAGAWRKLEVNGFVLMPGGDCEIAGDRLFVVDTARRLWSAPASRSFPHVDPDWERLSFPGLEVSRLSVAFEASRYHVLVTATDGAVWAGLLEGDRPLEWTRLWLPGELRIAAGVRLQSALPFADHLDAFAMATDGKVHTIPWDRGGGWGAWTAIRGDGQPFVATDLVGVVHRVNRQVEVFAQGNEEQLFRTWWA